MYGQADVESRAGAGCAFHGNRAVDRVDNLLYKCQSDACANMLGVAFSLIILFEDVILRFLVHAFSGVNNIQ